MFILWRWFALIVVAVGFCDAAQSTLAFGVVSFGNSPISRTQYQDWPEITSVLNHATRYYFASGGRCDTFAGLGHPDQINELINLYLKAGLKQPEIVLLPGPGHLESYMEQELFCDWRVDLCPTNRATNPPLSDSIRLLWPAEPRLFIYIGPRIPCEKLEIPTSAVVIDQEVLKERFREALFTSKEEYVRGTACHMLAAINPFDESSPATIREFLTDSGKSVRSTAASALGRFGRLALPYDGALERQLKWADPGLTDAIVTSRSAIAAAPDTSTPAELHALRQRDIEEWLAPRKAKSGIIPVEPVSGN